MNLHFYSGINHKIVSYVISHIFLFNPMTNKGTELFNLYTMLIRTIK